jgi:prepilin-type N-terminal cleavage/methylation domain-containing protein
MGIGSVRHRQIVFLASRRQLSRGFTLLEILLVVGIISIIAGFSMPVYQSFQVKNDLDIAAQTIATSFRRAQVLAEASDGDNTWGVEVISGSITVFQGVSYAARVAAFDEITSLPPTITPTGLSEVVFDRLTGQALSTGTVTLTTSTGLVRTIALSSKGTVTY